MKHRKSQAGSHAIKSGITDGGGLVGINLSEIIVICIVALLLFGPEQLPALARQLGKLSGEVRKGSNALRREFYNTVYPPDLADEFKAGSRIIRDLKAEVLAPPLGSAGTSSRQRPDTHAGGASSSAPQANLNSSAEQPSCSEQPLSSEQLGKGLKDGT